MGTPLYDGTGLPPTSAREAAPAAEPEHDTFDVSSATVAEVRAAIADGRLTVADAVAQELDGKGRRTILAFADDLED